MAAVGFDASWSDGSAINSVLDKFNSETNLTPEGGISFSDFHFQQDLSLLDDAFRYTDEICSREMSGMIHDAMIQIRKSGPVTKDALLTSLRQRAAAYLAKPCSRFTMWSRIRLRWIGQHTGFNIDHDGVRFQARGSIPNRLTLQEYRVNGVGRVDPNDLHGFGYLVARVDSRSEYDAAHRIFDAQDTLYALVNVLWRSWSIMGGEHHVEAELRQGPHQFFWNEGAFLGTDRLWFNIDHDSEEWERHPKDIRTFTADVLPTARRGLKKLQSHPLKGILVRAMKLISDGMSSRKSSYQLLRYWSAMEMIFSDNSKNIRYDDVVRRSLFAEIDPSISGLKLRYLAKMRNRYVHAGEENENLYSLIQFLRHFVCEHVSYLIYQGDDFETHADYLAMCDLPRDAASLEKRKLAISRRENIIAIRRHKPAG